jgi:hypothetical protein
MGLDINSERGQKSKKYENRAYEIIEKNKSGSIIETPKARDAKIDAFFVRDGVILGACETKCRQLTWNELKSFGTWLITNKKIEDGKKISKKLSVKFYGVLYLIPEDNVYIWEITDKNGNTNFNYKIKRTKTQKTINGGTAKRKNAFLPVEKIKYKMK